MTINKDQSNKACFPFFILAAVAFILAGFVGLLASIKVAFPSIEHTVLPFEIIRPFHTLLPIVGVLSGVQGWIIFITTKNNKSINKLLAELSFSLLIIFFFGAAISLLVGNFSGREYFSWPPIYTVPLILSLLISGFFLIKKIKYLSKKSPEGTWLIGFGFLFILIGLIESLGWLLPFVRNNFVKNLTVQWHSIDTFFAGLNAFLYGVGVFILQKEPKPLRKNTLYIIAVFSLLFTFGHHHYISPQPDFLKILAFLASMIAMFSFIKHLKAFKFKEKKRLAEFSVLEKAFKSVELWTIVSFASGILFAIPQVNLIIHGTYLIVIHAMGSMIGVQVMLVFIVGFSIFKPLTKKSEFRIKLGIKLLNIALILMWGLMVVAGLIKGFMRFNTDFYSIAQVIHPYLIILPIIGFLLFLSISIICTELLKSILNIDAVILPRRTSSDYDGNLKIKFNLSFKKINIKKNIFNKLKNQH